MMPGNIKHAVFEQTSPSYEGAIEDWEAFCNKLYGAININGVKYTAAEILFNLNENEYNSQMIAWAGAFTDEWIYNPDNQMFYSLPNLIHKWASRDYTLQEESNGSI